jgi:hypothetical protein
VKKYLHILLAFLLFLNSGGFVIVFYQIKYSIKHEMFENIKYHKDLLGIVSQFKIHRNNLYKDGQGFIWDGQNEFKIENKLYDVLELVEDINNTNYLIIYAINDLKEEMAIKSFSNLIDELVNEKIKSQRINTILLNLITQALIKVNFSLIPIRQCCIIIRHSEFMPKSLDQMPLLHPPKIS